MDRVSLPNYRWQLKAVRPKPAYPKSLKTLGDHLKVRRFDLALTQKEAAVRMAVDSDSVRNWEAGRTSIAVRCYPRLIQFLGYNPLPLATTPGQTIRRERMTRGWSRRKLAVAAHVDVATVRRMEADTKGTARKCLSRITALLGVQ